MASPQPWRPRCLSSIQTQSSERKPSPPPNLATITPGQILTRAIMTVTAMSLNLVKYGETSKKRPFIPVKVSGCTLNALYDTGADVSCLSQEAYRKMSRDSRPTRLPIFTNGTLRGANGGSLDVQGLYNMKLNILGQEVMHSFYVINNMKEDMIIGADLIQKY